MFLCQRSGGQKQSASLTSTLTQNSGPRASGPGENPMGHLLCLGPCHAQNLRLGVLAGHLPGQVNFALSTPLRAATGR